MKLGVSFSLETILKLRHWESGQLTMGTKVLHFLMSATMECKVEGINFLLAYLSYCLGLISRVHLDPFVLCRIKVTCNRQDFFKVLFHFNIFDLCKGTFLVLLFSIILDSIRGGIALSHQKEDQRH